MVVQPEIRTFIDDNQQATSVMTVTTDYKVTTLFCVIDDFRNHFETGNTEKMLLEEDGE